MCITRTKCENGRSLQNCISDDDAFCFGLQLSSTGDDLTEPVDLNTRMTRETFSIVKNADIPPVPQLALADRDRLIRALDRWDFQPQKLPDEEVLACTIILFEALWRIEGMDESMQADGLYFETLPPLLAHLQSLYRYYSQHSHALTASQHTLQNPYHNFSHALDVLQSSYIFLKDAGVVPPVSILLQDSSWKRPARTKANGPVQDLQLIDLVVICLAAVGHDVGHPGFANGFMRHAASPLADLYSDTSPLEALHTSILLQTLKVHGLLSFLTAPRTLSDGDQVRGYVCRLITRMVMCTDLGVHDAWVAKWEHEWEGIAASNVNFGDHPHVFPVLGSNPLWTRKVLICQAIIKCADISNPTRPYEITLAWSSALLHEWISQANLERLLDIPVTALTAATPLAEAQSQVGFTKKFALPLFELVGGSVMPCMRKYTAICKENLVIWEAKKSRFENTACPEREEREKELNSLEPRLPREYLGVFSLCVPERFSSILPGHDLISDSETGTSVPTSSAESDMYTSTPTSPRSPLSPELTPPSSPTSSASSSLFSPHASLTILNNKKSRRRVVSNNSSSGTSVQSQVPPPPKPNVQPNKALKIGTVLLEPAVPVPSASSGNVSASSSNTFPRRGTSGAWRRPAISNWCWRNWDPSATASDNSPSSASTTTTTCTLFSPSTPTSTLTSASPITPSDCQTPSPGVLKKRSSYRKPLNKTPALAKSPSFGSFRTATSPISLPPPPLLPPSSKTLSANNNNNKTQNGVLTKPSPSSPKRLGNSGSATTVTTSVISKSRQQPAPTANNHHHTSSNKAPTYASAASTIVVSPPTRKGLFGYRTPKS